MEMVVGNYDVLVIMVFHECFNGEIISYHLIYILLETFENFTKFEKHWIWVLSEIRTYNNIHMPTLTCTPVIYVLYYVVLVKL